MSDTTSLRGKRPARRGALLRLVLINLTLVLVAFGVYFAVYVDGRLERTTVRNFRALDAAAERLGATIRNLPEIGDNVPLPFGGEAIVRDAAQIREAERQRIQTLQTVQMNLARRKGAPADVDNQLTEQRARLDSLDEALRTEWRTSLPPACPQEPGEVATWSALQRISSGYIDDFDAVAEIDDLRINPLRRQAAAPAGAAQTKRTLQAEACLVTLSQDSLDACSHSATTLRLLPLADGPVVELQNCRPLAARSATLAHALADAAPDSETPAIKDVLAQLGVRLTIPLDELADTVADNVAPLFDQFLIADADGRVLYTPRSEDDSLEHDAVIGAPATRRVPHDFVSQVDVNALVAQSATRRASPWHQSVSQVTGGTRQHVGEWQEYGIHSHRESLRVGDVGFEAFVHPVALEHLRYAPGARAQEGEDEASEDNGQEGAGESGGGGGENAGGGPDDGDGLLGAGTELASGEPTVLYLIGIVGEERLTRDSLRLPLSLVSDALLLIGVLIACAGFLWLWTAGDRLMLGRRHLALLVVSGITASILYTLFSIQLLTRGLDGKALDQAMESVHERIRMDFQSELLDWTEQLAHATARMLTVHGEAPARAFRGAGASTSSPSVARDEGDIEGRYYCRPAAHGATGASPPAPPARIEEEVWPTSFPTDRRYPVFELAFLLDEDGVQWQCLSYRLFDTPPVDLGFREYFQRPSRGDLWRVRWLGALADEGPHGPAAAGGVPAARSPPRRTAAYLDRERLADLPPGQYDDGLVWPAQPPGLFLQRITSVLDGTTETVLSARPSALCRFTGADGRPLCDPSPDGRPSARAGEALRTEPGAAPRDPPTAAVLIGRLQSLEETILPPHLRYAVIDNRTGQTLFHSVRSRSLATNFIRETEGSPELLAHIGAGTSGFVPLDYHGSRIRAHVSPLIPGIPWTLVTYRGHELEDTIGLLTVSLDTALLFMSGLLILLVGGPLLALTGGLLHRAGVWPERWQTPLIERLRHALPALTILAGAIVVLLVTSGFRAPHWWPVAVVVAGQVVALCLVLLPWRPSTQTGTARRDELATPASLTLLILLVAVLPAVGGFIHFRAELTADLATYLHQKATEAVAAKCARHRTYARRYKLPYRNASRQDSGDGEWRGVFTHGWPLVASGDRGHTSVPGVCEGFKGADDKLMALDRLLVADDTAGRTELFEPFQRVASFSPLASELFAQAGIGRTARDLHSPGAVVDRLTSERPREPLARLTRVHTGAFLLVVALGLALLAVIVLSLVDRLLGARRRLQVVADVSLDRPPMSWRGHRPLYGCVVHRSLPLCREFLDSLRPYFGEIRMARWQPGEARFDFHRLAPPAAERGDPQDAKCPDAGEDPPATARTGSGPALHVIEGMEQHVLDDAARGALLATLERLLGSASSVLMFSQVLPGYWLARSNRELTQSGGGASAQAARATRWSYVLSPLDVRRLRENAHTLEARFSDELRREHDEAVENGLHGNQPPRDDAGQGRRQDAPAATGPDPDSPLFTAMKKEAIANPTLLRLAAAIAYQTWYERGKASGGRRGDGAEAAAVALERFSVRAAGYFHKLWWTSTLEEQLQLLSLARGGYADPARSALLSSLANRGLIERSGPVRLRSAAFGRFIARDLIHDELLAWRDEAHGNTWRTIWPPLLVLLLLAVAFFVSSTPEALAPLAAVLAAGVGAIPVLGSLLRNMGELRRFGNGNQ